MPTRKQIEDMKKAIMAEDKANDALLTKVDAAAKQADALKNSTKKAKAELGKETD